MRKIILMMSVSVDGFIEGPGHELDWHRDDLDPRPRPMSRSLPAGLQRETSERWPGRRTLPGGIFPNGSGGSLGGGVD